MFKMYSGESAGGKYPPLRRRKDSDCRALEIDQVPIIWTPDGKAVYPEYLTDINTLLCPSDPDISEVLEGGEFHCATDPASDRPHLDNDPEEPICPCKIWPISYFYYSWALKPEHYLRAPVEQNLNTKDETFSNWLATGFTEGLADALLGILINQNLDRFEQDVTVEYEDFGTMTIYRLCEGIERFIVEDISAPGATAEVQSGIPVMHDMLSTNPEVYGSVVANHIPGGGNVLYMDGHVEFIKYPDEWPICGSWSLVMSKPESLIGILP